MSGPPRLEQRSELGRSTLDWRVVLAWLAVSLPLLWGIWQTLKKAAVLFR